MPQEIFLLLGGNIGNRELFLEQARQGIATDVGAILKASSIYETAAWGVEDQQPFLNQVLQIESNLSAREVLEKTAAIESALGGRKRTMKWGARSIDIDLLFYGKMVLASEVLTIPHPAIQDRLFTLIPLAEIAPNFQHPILSKTCLQLLEDCKDPLPVALYKPY